MVTLNQAHDDAMVLGIIAERAGMRLTKKRNPSMTELAREAQRIGINLGEMVGSLNSVVRCQ